MFLRSLTMKGFKSFAEATTLEFEPGVTVVVGPNGSGKSNVVDAVTWVLGAQGPRLLRSLRMEDVIFAGTVSRPPLGRAEVSLTIDNSSGRLPIELAEVTVTRTLFRTGDSEYAINGTPCRLLDVQELLADSGVGRQQHMIVGQGQLETVLGARPEDRRTIIEEAAGVLKHRRRRERAERRLAATEENLARLGDLLREVRRQIRPLERQAEAARSHAALREELRLTRLHLSGRELAELARRHEHATGQRSSVAAEERELGRALALLDAEASRATAQLSALQGDDLAGLMARVQGLRERARGTAAVLRERARSLQSSLDAAASTDVVSSLEAEGASLSTSLEELRRDEQILERDRGPLEREGDELAAAERALSDAPTADLGQAQQALSVASERLSLLRHSREQHDQRVVRIEVRRRALEARFSELTKTGEELERSARDAALELTRLNELARRAEVGAERQAGVVTRVERESEVARDEAHRTAARAEALRKSYEQLRNQPGRQELVGANGVVGTLAELVTVAPGWERAFEAAVGSMVDAVVLDAVGPAREAVQRLHDRGLGGALLPAGGPATAGDGGRAPEGERALDGEGPEPVEIARAGPALDLPDGAEPLRPQVKVRPGRVARALARTLDRLFERVVAVGDVHRALDLALRRPDLVVVSRAGDRFTQTGWRVRWGARDPTLAAVREAEAQAESAAATAVALEDGRKAAAAALAASEAEQTACRHALDEHRARVAAVGADRARLADAVQLVRTDLDELEQQLTDARAEGEGLETQTAELEAAVPALEQALGEVQRLEDERARRYRMLSEGRHAYEHRRHVFEVRAAELAERKRALSDRAAEVERRLAGHAEERRHAADRRERLERHVRAVGRMGDVVSEQQRRLEGVHAHLLGAYREQVESARAGGERLDALHRQRADTERRLETLRDRGRAFDLELAELGMRATAVTEVVQGELGSEPEAAVHAPCPDLPEGVSAEEHAGHLTGRLEALGPINPLALQELSTLEERSADLEGQVQDVRTARRELQHVVRYLDGEIADGLATAVHDVERHFRELASALFPGGSGRIVLTTPDDLLNTGVDIELRPPGRNVRRISLLSGGERSLVALAFLFAVFRSRPSPFYLMDEVEAALDDVNLHRFLELVDGFRAEAQLIIVSHQKRTMEMADALYGVTMAPGGSSQVVSHKVDKVDEDRATDTAGAQAAAGKGDGAAGNGTSGTRDALDNPLLAAGGRTPPSSGLGREVQPIGR